MIKQILLKNKNSLKYKDYEIKGEKITVLGIGKKSIKYAVDDGEHQFASYDEFKGKIIARAIIKTFENEMWNDDVIACIEAQKKYCKDNQAPHFAPEDGFCWSCGKQIYANGRDITYASSELITGCPHCHRSYCD